MVDGVGCKEYITERAVFFFFSTKFILFTGASRMLANFLRRSLRTFIFPHVGGTFTGRGVTLGISEREKTSPWMEGARAAAREKRSPQNP